MQIYDIFFDVFHVVIFLENDKVYFSTYFIINKQSPYLKKRIRIAFFISVLYLCIVK